MANNLDWSQCPAVESIPGKVSGAWVFRGTRMPVQTVFVNLEAGMSVDEDHGSVRLDAGGSEGGYSLRQPEPCEATRVRLMKMLFDNGTPKPIARSLPGHEITYSRQIGWHELKNGELIEKAEEAGYELLLNTDKNIRYRQDLTGGKTAWVVLGNQQWPLVKLHLEKTTAAVEACAPGSYVEVDIPFPAKQAPGHCFSRGPKSRKAILIGSTYLKSNALFLFLWPPLELLLVGGGFLHFCRVEKAHRLRQPFPCRRLHDTRGETGLSA